MDTTVEFIVQMSCESCVTKIDNSLKNFDGIKNVTISKENGTVVVESELLPNVIQERIQTTGRKVSPKGSESDEKDLKSENVEFISGPCDQCKSETENPAQDGQETLENGDKNTTGENDGPVKKKRSKTGAEFKSDDEEELELKYSSDSDDDYENRNIFSGGGGDDVWKIAEEEFDVIDADDDENADQDKSKSDMDTSQGNLESGRKRKLTSQTGAGSSNESDDEHKSDAEKDGESKKKKSFGDLKFIDKMKSSTIRKGDFNLMNSHISLQIIIMPENDEETLKEEDAQVMKDTLCKELFKRGHQIRCGVPGITQLKFTDCKLVKPGWLLLTCDDKYTYDWLMAWEIPRIEDRTFKSIPATNKAPPQTIKFSIKNTTIPNDETMLKLIHLQNRNIDTKVWDLKSKTSMEDSMDEYHFQVDCGTVRALERTNWSFFYELCTVKIIEHNEKAVGGTQAKSNKAAAK